MFNLAWNVAMRRVRRRCCCCHRRSDFNYANEPTQGISIEYVERLYCNNHWQRIILHQLRTCLALGCCCCYHSTQCILHTLLFRIISSLPIILYSEQQCFNVVHSVKRLKKTRSDCFAKSFIETVILSKEKRARMNWFEKKRAKKLRIVTCPWQVTRWLS